MQSNAISVFSVDVHVATCPAARLRLSRFPRASRLSQQLCLATLRRLTSYVCARFLNSSAAWFCAQALLLGFLEQLCCVVLCASSKLDMGDRLKSITDDQLAGPWRTSICSNKNDFYKERAKRGVRVLARRGRKSAIELYGTKAGALPGAVHLATVQKYKLLRPRRLQGRDA